MALKSKRKACKLAIFCTKILDSIKFAPLHPAPAQVAEKLKSKNTQSTQKLKMLHNLCSQRFTKADFKDYATLHKTTFKFQH